MQACFTLLCFVFLPFTDTVCVCVCVCVCVFSPSKFTVCEFANSSCKSVGSILGCHSYWMSVRWNKLLRGRLLEDLPFPKQSRRIARSPHYIMFVRPAGRDIALPLAALEAGTRLVQVNPVSEQEELDWPPAGFSSAAKSWILCRYLFVLFTPATFAYQITTLWEKDPEGTPRTAAFSGGCEWL